MVSAERANQGSRKILLRLKLEALQEGGEAWVVVKWAEFWFQLEAGQPVISNE